MLATEELQSPQRNAWPRAFHSLPGTEMQRQTTEGRRGNLLWIIAIGVMPLLLVKLTLY